MNFLAYAFHNPLFVASACSWLVAQLSKTILYMIINHKFNFERIFGAGGMPSAHSATVCALVVSTAVVYGPSGFEFPMAVFFAFIVMYDACHVRYYSGKNIELTQQLVKDLREMTGLRFDDPIYQEKLKNVLGHKFVEVIGGFVVGLIVPLILCPLFL